MKNLTKHKFIILLGFVLLLLTPTIVMDIQAQSGGDFDLTKSTIDGGGQSSSGGDFVVNGTIGQMDSTNQSALTGGVYLVAGGFWAAYSSDGSEQIYLPIIAKN